MKRNLADATYGAVHFERIIERLRVDGIVPNVFYHAGIDDLCIMVESSPSSPFDLYFDTSEEFWGADADGQLAGIENLVLWTECFSSEKDAAVMAKAIIDATKDFRDKHPYEKTKDGFQALPTDCEGIRCPHIIRDKS